MKIHEKPPTLLKQEMHKISPERQANSQENPSLLLISRLRNPQIRKQLISLYRSFYVCSDSTIDTKGLSISLEDAIDQAIEKRIKAIERETLIHFREGSQHSSGVTNCDLLSRATSFEREQIQVMIGKMPILDENKIDQIQGIIVAHEKGHVVRAFDEEYFDKYFIQGFIPNYKEVDIEPYRVTYTQTDQASEYTSENELMDGIMDYLFTGPEIAERMSQLKAYYGMQGDELFTKEHLDYAKKNYIKDTGLDNFMAVFFSSITQESETKFLEIINTSGI